MSRNLFALMFFLAIASAMLSSCGGKKWTSPKDGMTMLYIPAGEFLMGNEKGRDNAKPVHTVYLDSYWIDRTEVTNAMYAKCVVAGECNPPDVTKSRSHIDYYGVSEFADYPVIFISWNDAHAYCAWRGDGARLPTEAEWEKAASWDPDKQQKRVYPWGDSIDCTFSNYAGKDRKGCVKDTAKVGEYPSGASFYGVLDMAGNVWEWAADWFSDTYYSVSPTSNPLGPDSGSLRVLRGGSWYDYDEYARSAFRYGGFPDKVDITYSGIGFRCARSLP